MTIAAQIRYYITVFIVYLFTTVWIFAAIFSIFWAILWRTFSAQRCENVRQEKKWKEMSKSANHCNHRLYGTLRNDRKWKILNSGPRGRGFKSRHSDQRNSRFVGSGFSLCFLQAEHTASSMALLAVSRARRAATGGSNPVTRTRA